VLPTTNDNILDLVVTLQWDQSYNINLGAVSSSFSMGKVGSEVSNSGFETQKFAASSDANKSPITWVLNQWYTILEIRKLLMELEEI
jgi:hypothetical protein